MSYTSDELRRAREYLDGSNSRASYLKSFQAQLKASIPPPPFWEFIQRTSPITCEPWQVKLCDRLQLFLQQDGQRLVIKGPPQAGKSVVVSQRLAPYFFGTRNDGRFRLITYNETHSEKSSKVMLEMMKSKEYRSMFLNPNGYPPQVASTHEWSTPARTARKDAQTSFSALGLSSGSVGVGGDVWAIDDPYRSRDDAFSDTINTSVWNNWKEVIEPRLSPQDNVLSMAHAWNERDFNAQLLMSGGFEEIRIPSICDAENDFAGRPYIKRASEITYEEYLTLGKEEQLHLEQAALTPRQPLAHLLKMRDGYKDEKGNQVAGIGTAVFESLHQGNPKARGGTRFKLEDFAYVPEYEHAVDSLLFSYWDLGGTEESSGDRTVNCLLHKTPGGIYTYLETTWCRLREKERNTFIYNTEKRHAETYGPHTQVFSFVEQQPGIGTDISSEIIRMCAEWGMSNDRVTRPLTERCIPLSVQMQNHNVRFIKGDWNQLMQDEFIGFPNAKHDDFVSAASGAFNVAVKYVMM